MFTGIIQVFGKIKVIEKKGESGRIVVEIEPGSKDINTGDSIAVDGVCLTVVKHDKDSFTADISKETINLTTIGELKIDSKVNLEWSLTPSTPMGGHIVTGHIDGVGVIRKKEVKGGNAELEVLPPPEVMGQIVKKGSVAIDGISLTIAETFKDKFRVVLIPHTLNNTTLSFKGPGDRLNIETDIIAKYVERFLGSYKGGKVTEEFLMEHGFK